MYYPVLTLGPGRRLGIWTRGCARGCPGCMSPDMQQADPRREMPLRVLLAAVDHIMDSQQVDGVTISGGEPLEQAGELELLLRHLRRRTQDILLYTGYTAAEIEKDPALRRAAVLAGVVVAGPYVEALNDGRALRGSSNQEIICNAPELESAYEQILRAPRSVQTGRSAHDVFLIGLLG